MGIPLKTFDCKNEWRNSIDDNSDEVPELNPVILVKIYPYFAANSVWRRGALTSCVETTREKPKVREKKLSSVCKAKNYWKSHVQADALSFAFYNGPKVQR